MTLAGPESPEGSPRPETRHRAADFAVTDSELAVLLRQTQWALDEAAFEWPRGQVTPRQREELARTLEGLAGIVRASAPGGAR